LRALCLLSIARFVFCASDPQGFTERHFSPGAVARGYALGCLECRRG